MPDNYEVYYLGTADSPMFLQQWLQGLLDDNLELVCFSEGWWVFRKIYPLTVPENEGCKEVHWDCKIAQLEAEIARRDEIIIRLKEDGERLAGKLISMYADEMYECSYCGHGVSKSPDEIDHSPDCPITLHHALMKELE